MDEEILRYTEMLQECAGRILGWILTNKYTGKDLPYRWEFHSNAPPAFHGALQLDGPDILRMQAMCEADQRGFLRSKLEDAVAKHRQVLTKEGGQTLD
jgi:hypothetical protein